MPIAAELATQCTLPPEWAAQSGVMLTWPHQETIWVDMLEDIDHVFVQVSAAITQYEKLIITCFDDTHRQHIMSLLQQANINITKIHFPLAASNDIWVRDHGPICVMSADNKHHLLDFTFNGWGNKYPADNDNQLSSSLFKKNIFGTARLNTIDMVLEGGSIEVDGHGTLLTTSSCLLSSTRNPAISKSGIESQLKKLFGLKRILWLDHGYLAGDDTDGHIDTLARFVNPHTICYTRCTDQHDEHYTALANMEAQLKTLTDYQGNPYTLIPLPWPQAVFAAYDGRRLPATYANFLIINGAVLVPTYRDPADAEALQTLAACFPDRKMIPIDSLPVIQWNGSIHCMTMQLPDGVLI